MMGMICGLALNLFLWRFMAWRLRGTLVLGSVATFTVVMLRASPWAKGLEMQVRKLTTERRNPATEIWTA